METNQKKQENVCLCAESNHVGIKIFPQAQKSLNQVKRQNAVGVARL